MTVGAGPQKTLRRWPSATARCPSGTGTDRVDGDGDRRGRAEEGPAGDRLHDDVEVEFLVHVAVVLTGAAAGRLAQSLGLRLGAREPGARRSGEGGSVLDREGEAAAAPAGSEPGRLPEVGRSEQRGGDAAHVRRRPDGEAADGGAGASGRAADHVERTARRRKS